VFDIYYELKISCPCQQKAELQKNPYCYLSCNMFWQLHVGSQISHHN